MPSTSQGDNTNKSGDEHITYAGQSSLPRLPIPSLEETLNRFPSTVSALLTNDVEKEECEHAVKKFLLTDGPNLQQLLVDYDAKGKENGNVGSYVEEFWTDAYLAPDSSVVMNLNPFFVLEVCVLYHVTCVHVCMM